MNAPEERIIATDLSGEMSRSYLEYAMSVIVGRALPDARDGLKPVHRRILYAMYELGLTPDRPFRKCARVVGEVLGKYHPHGDTAVYDALVRMAQDFSMRSPLIAGHGNFGSVDNDPPAAMRYTECRLQSLSTSALLTDIEAETVDFIDNFDGSQQEPTVLPARVPQILINGSSGIAVGMATNIPPHNLGEVIDGTIALINNPELTDSELRRYIPGPDFPTGGQILGTSGIKEAYTTGRGSVTMRGVASIETVSAKGRPDKDAIIVTELPYQTNKASLIEKIAELVNDKKIDGISDIRDESDRTGMRIVIELKRDAYPQVVLNNLYKQTPIQSNFGCNMLALVNGEPQLLTIKRFLEVFIDFRVECIIRRTQFQLRKAEQRDHILQGLLIALGSNLEEVIRIIRQSADTVSAKAELSTAFGLTDIQADAILQMQLRRLTALEADKIQQEHEDLLLQITDLQDILARRERIEAIIIEELTQIQASHSTPRVTEIIQAQGDLLDRDLIANEKSVILITEQGYIKRMAIDDFEQQNRATRGKAAAKMKEDDGVSQFLTCCDHDDLLFFSDQGLVYSLPAYQVPAVSRTARGMPMVQMLPISKDDKITSVLSVSEFVEDQYIVMLTRKGFIKKTVLTAFSNIRSNGLIAISLADGDQLKWVKLATEEDSIIIGSKNGMAIHFQVDSKQLRPLSRNTKGVRAMKLKSGDELINMDILSAQVLASLAEAEEDGEDEADDVSEDPKDHGPWVLVVSNGGFGKRVPVNRFRLQNRAGMGLRAMKFRLKGDTLATLDVVYEDSEMMIISNRGIMIRQRVNAISLQSRNATGVRVQRLDKDDSIAAVGIVPSTEDEEETDDETMELNGMVPTPEENTSEE
jgi:DNA gyrase subunit A